MEQSNIKAIKELVDPNDLPELISNCTYPKPRWMLNESASDTTWLFPKIGIEISFFEKNKDKALKLSFKRKIAPDKYLTDSENEAILTDIKNSLLYLTTTGKITRPKRLLEITTTATKLINHANELRHDKKKPLVRSLEHIKFKELKDYLLSFNVERAIFNKTLNLILKKWSSKSDIDWMLIKSEFGLTTRRLDSLKHKIIQYLKSEEIDGFSSQIDYKREYENANNREFDIDFNLFPSESIISNEISKLEALYTSRTAQRYKFQHSPMKIFSGGEAIFYDMVERIKTPLMPVLVSLHAISSALSFTRIYGASLRQYLSDLSKAEENRIKELSIALSTSRNHNIEIKNHAFENVEIPSKIKSLNITSWGGGDDTNLKYSELRNGMSVRTAVRLYTAAMYIQLASFSAGRSSSLQTLRRNCFVLSPIDGLFDLVMRIPKSSERIELEEVHRPIPDVIYDYGLEFALLVCELEERRGFIGAEHELFLFGNALSYRSVSAARKDGGEICKYPLGNDYLNNSLHMFIDWSESPLIGEKRWYPSTHQFRRLFAVMYFNFSDEVGLDELSWFMGHSNLDQTFHYAEVSPDDEWIDEAEAAIARIGASLHKLINADETVRSIIDKARKSTSISAVLEPLVRRLIEKHKNKTGQEVRFYKIDKSEVFFYFINPEVKE
ncbi:Site-specific integrase [Vibrio crassostreae]|nr:Site-specific integrase [Vibrio crassostreae]